MSLVASDLRTFVADRLVARNAPSRAFFDRERHRLAVACEQMARRFRAGGRLLAFGRGAAATDAQHVTVEFVHPVIVGKRALPALDLSPSLAVAVPALMRGQDIAMGFNAHSDREVSAALAAATALGAQTFALPGAGASYAIGPPAADGFIAQELIEILYHTLWETVHVFLEYGASFEESDDLGATAFLYPFLGDEAADSSYLVDDVAASIAAKAAEDEGLRERTAREQAGAIADAIAGVQARIQQGATLLFFGNGGSATDANDWAIDCVEAASPAASVPAISLASDAATITALANDVGEESVFLRQLIAHGRPGDVAIAISTSGGSANVIAALQEARARGMQTVALLGYDGGEIVRQRLADLPIVVHCDYIPRIQEVQASIYHVMTEAWHRWPV